MKLRCSRCFFFLNVNRAAYQGTTNQIVGKDLMPLFIKNGFSTFFRSSFRPVCHRYSASYNRRLDGVYPYIFLNEVEK
jgi:hypothetical protein